MPVQASSDPLGLSPLTTNHPSPNEMQVEASSLTLPTNSNTNQAGAFLGILSISDPLGLLPRPTDHPLPDYPSPDYPSLDRIQAEAPSPALPTLHTSESNTY